ncbi:MAG: conjugal transfer protein TrbF [Hyphococcus sp.]|nr:MAG: conjugal transfer protein TrbF [Marinicaulis sp.]
MWKRNQDAFGKTPEPETPYQRAGQVWDDRIGSARVQARNWRLAAFVSLAMSAALAGGLVWRSGQSLVTPYVVEVTADGGVRAVGPARGAFSPSDAQIAHHLASFIRNVRAVSIDPVVVRQNWLSAYDFATDRGAAALNEYARVNDPFTEVGQRSVSVDINSIVRSSDTSFEIRWRENEYRNGNPVGTETYTAVLSIVMDAPRTAEALHKNPLGIYVHGLNWSKDLNGG